MSAGGTHVGDGVRRGGLAPGSYEAKAAIERIRLINFPDKPKKSLPAWSIQTERAEPERERLMQRTQCERCHKSIDWINHRFRYCEPCGKAVQRERERAYRAKTKFDKVAECKACSASFVRKTAALYCDACREKRAK
jgi:Zn finger protein HypA/HybF involved in hydrogenase expression